MSTSRRNGLIRLAILVASGIGLIALGVNVVSGSGSGSSSSSAARGRPTAPTRLVARESRTHLPVALHGLTAAPSARGLLVIGGADGGEISRDSVYVLAPSAGRVWPVGSLAQPLHDAAAVSLNRQTLVFGGGNTTTLNTVQLLATGARAAPIGRLPAALSDLSSVRVGSAAYVIGGFDGTRPTGAVLQTTDGQTFTRVARLPTAVRYAAVAALPDKIYVFGGELGSGRDTNEIQEYDIATERAVVAGHLPAAVSHASAVTLNGTIFLLGGRLGESGTDRIYRFDPSHSAVHPAGRLPRPVYDGTAGTFHDRAYLVGGIGRSGSSLSTVIALRPIMRR